MNLFGVVHDETYFYAQISVIEILCNNVKDKKILLELAPNAEKYIKEGVLHHSFFSNLAEYYRNMGAQVICGDQNLTIPKNKDSSDWLLAVYIGESFFYPNNKRDIIIRQKIRRYSPEIIIVGNGHSDEIKQHFPELNYVVFQKNGGHQSPYSHHGRIHEWYKPDRVISLPTDD